MSRQEEKKADAEKLLTRVLEECLDEDLSFVPPEREIARNHTFSEPFEEKMDQLINDGEEAVRKEKEQEIRRHFSPRYGQMAAAVLIFLVAGFLVWNVKDQLHPETAMESTGTENAMDTSACDDAMVEESAAEDEEEVMTMAESAEAAVQEDAAVDQADAGAKEISTLEEEWAKGEINDPSREGVSYCGKLIYPAVQQEVPEYLEEVTTLVNCSVQDEENTTMVLSIGNIGENTVRYLDGYDIEVQVGSTWYVIPHKQYAQRIWKNLEGKMAIDMEINLSDFDIDYGAQEYRIIAYVDGQQVSAEFIFGEVFDAKMEEQEAAEASEQ